jgi:hypothetical protein
VIAAAALIDVFLVGFLGLAIWQSGSAIERARMTGRVVAKEFVPAPEHQVSLVRQSGLKVADSSGEYILTVEVSAENGLIKPFHVWVNKRRYEAVQVGDSFDVGPYLVRE